MMRFRIALAQTQIIFGEPAANLENTIRLIQIAANNQTNLILFPELFSSGFDLPNCESIAMENQAFIQNISELLQRTNITIGGSLIEKDNQGKFHNTFYLLQPGAPMQIYRKIHLFKPLQEHRIFEAGNTLGIAQWNNQAVGLSICYDLRFPELFRKYAIEGCKIILLSAEFPQQRIHHWEILLRARAIENQVFVAATNAVGRTGDLNLGGLSIVIDPWGNTLGKASPDKEDLFWVDINLDQVAAARQSFSTIADNCPHLLD